MRDITPDICDKFERHVNYVNLPLCNFGQRAAFWGEIVTIRCYHDNSKVRELLGQDGRGKVLVVDGNGSSQRALLGDQLAILAIENHWEGIIINGAIRDAAAIAEMDIGVQALGTCPFKTEKRGAGEVNVMLTIHNQMIRPGDYIYADWNGVLTSTELLNWN
ncbi:ribonuclease activity regulator protein RraA [Vibrio ponticus]|uniref:4-hydroxy-4-methyl-2-oxoglutarate aldolase n=1 Tax=Vibrio ponticus TaxID=265668 RepID=A0A3N3E3A3_9VIBR|nr:putative 4-hydroxy-4-methyl-2-oxoglutarate aldolase [Vibrio ponticus]OLQ87517.1 ribonuclease activity regulator protein RraA [Vibrio ponticus]ROV61196.1 putative 4-hydroxy-4-methyl-2-oxoglutarate aldolase [Vibrio ponticus]